MNCIKDGKYTGDSCFGCKVKVGDCEIRDKVYKQRWIPVCERLPEEAGTYLGTVKFIDSSIGVYPVWYHNGIRTDILWEMDNQSVNVVAWRPLPEPWKEGDFENARNS